MPATPVAFGTKDNASGRLNATISPSDVSVPLQSGNGANFPQPYSSTCTSLGSAVLLNGTGISATVGGSAVVGKWVWNKTDGSVAVIQSVSTNAIATSRLMGGTLNLWSNADRWCIDPFVVTFGVLSTSAYGVQSDGALEEALVIGRATDILTVAAAGRGYNATTAQQFASGDFVYLRVTSPIFERFKDVLSVVAVQQDADRTSLATAQTNITNQQTGSYHYVVATGSLNAYAVATPALAAYAAGNIVRFKANFSTTAAATLNVNALGAVAIKKNDGATALGANDIVSGQIVEVEYDGTNFQMLSPVGTPASQTSYSKEVALNVTDSSARGASSVVDFLFDNHTFTIPANDLVAGVAYEIEAYGTMNWGAGNVVLYVQLGATQVIATQAITPTTSPEFFKITTTVYGTAAAGGSVTVRAGATFGYGIQAQIGVHKYAATAGIATNGTLVLQLGGKFGTSHAGNILTLSISRIRKVSTSAF